MLRELQEKIIAFREERDWKKYNTPKNLAISVCLESAELLEIFQWSFDKDLDTVVQENREQLEDEMADVLIYLLHLAHETNIDLEKAAFAKMEKNAIKYPVDKAKGSARKYDQLD